MSRQEISVGSGVIWDDEHTKLNSNFIELYGEIDSLYSDNLPGTGTDGQSVVYDGNQWIYDSSLVATNNGGTIVNGWVRQYADFVLADWFSSLQEAVNVAATGEVKLVRLLAKTYEISTTLNVPYTVSVIGSGSDETIIKPVDGALLSAFTNGFMVTLNGDAADGGWDEDFPPVSGEISNLQLSNTTTPIVDLRGIYIADKHKIENISTYNLYNSISYTSLYLDSKNLTGVQIRQSLATTDYAVESSSDPSLGDALHFDRLQIGFDAGSFVDGKALKISGCQGGSITNSNLNGGVLIEKSNGLTLSNNHYEYYGDRPSLTIDECAGSIKVADSHIEVGDNTAINIIGSDATIGNLANVLVDNLTFYSKTRTRLPSGIGASISTSNVLLTIRDSYRSIGNGSVTRSNAMGLKVLNADTGLPIDGFAERSFLYSGYCQILDTDIVDYQTSIQGGSGVPSADGFDISVSTDQVDWTEASGTYYYAVSNLYDVERRIGLLRTEEESKALTNGGEGAELKTWATGGYSDIGIVRVYRGASSGVYDYYADIPVMRSVYYYDTGSEINGVAWVPRTPGPKDTLNTAMGTKIIASRDNVTVYADTVAAPSVGTWAQNDRIRGSAISLGTFREYICVTSGTPGSWGYFDTTLV